MYSKFLILLNSILMCLALTTRKPTVNNIANCRPNCTSNDTRPLDIYNSRYTILNNTGLCCPRDIYCEDGQSYCSPEQDVIAHCHDRGVVYEPCHHCMTCAKLKGEDCGGVQNIYGKCGEGLECLKKNQSDEEEIGACTTAGGPEIKMVGKECGGKYDSFGKCVKGSRCKNFNKIKLDICVRKEKTKVFRESCGGAYGSLGRCRGAYRCSVLEDNFLKGENISGTCFHSNADDVCFKNCSTRATSPVCGTDGIWYRNKCFLRYQNCWERSLRISKTSLESTCKGVYTPLPPPPPTTTTSTLPSTKLPLIDSGNGVELTEPDNN